MTTNLTHEKGPFDIIGDIHGCFDELYRLLNKLGYDLHNNGNHYQVTHPQQRKVIFVGDLVDRGPKTPEVLRLVMDMVETGTAICVNGNHDDKLKRYLQGRNVKIAHGLEESITQLSCESVAFKERILNFLTHLPSHCVVDNGKLAIVHAALKETYIGQESVSIRSFCMYGPTTREIDRYGLPVRYPWAQDYHGNTLIVYGHTPVPNPQWINNTINIDTGCVFGGKLTALRYPEKELISEKAAAVYCVPVKSIEA